MEKVTIEINKTTLEKLKELSESLDFIGEPSSYDELILAMLKYMSNKTRKPLIS